MAKTTASIRSGDASDADPETTPWDNGVPESGDTVTISATHNVRWNLDLTAGTITLTVNGKLYLDDTLGAGTFGFGLASSVAGSAATGSIVATADGTVSGGNLANQTKVLINAGASNRLSNSGPVVTLKCTQPSALYVKLAAAASATDTRLYISEADYNSIVADPVWTTASAIIHIANINKGKDVEERTINAIGTGGGQYWIDITAGLTAGKLQYSYIAVMTRNITITGTGSYVVYGGTGHTLGAEINGISRFMESMSNSTFSGAARNGSTYGILYATILTMSGTISNFSKESLYQNGPAYRTTFSGLILGSNVLAGYRLYGTTSAIIASCGAGMYSAYAGLDYRGTIDGCTIGVNNCNGRVSGTIRNCDYGVSSSNVDLSGATLTGNAISDIAHNASRVIGHGTTLGSGTQVSNIIATESGSEQVVIYDIGGIDGALKAWMAGALMAAGGIVNNDDPGEGFVSVLPNAKCYTFNCASASYPAFLDFSVRKIKSVPLVVIARMRQNASGMTERPTVQLINPANDPLFGGTALATQMVTDDTFWQTLTINYNPSDAANYDRGLIVRLRMRDASKVGYGGFTVAGGGGGGAVGRGFNRGMA